MKTSAKAFAEKFLWEGQRAEDLDNAQLAYSSLRTVIEQVLWRQDVVPTLKDDRHTAVAATLAVLGENVKQAARVYEDRWEEPDVGWGEPPLDNHL